MASSRHLPRLALGDKQAQLSLTAKDAGDRLSRTLPTLKDFLATGPADAYLSRSFRLKMASASVHCGAALGSSISHVGESDGLHVYLPVVGGLTIHAGDHSLSPEPGRSLAILPGLERRTQAAKRSLAIIALDPARLLAMCDHLMQAAAASTLDLEHPRTVLLQRQNEDFHAAYLSLLGTIDAVIGSEQAITALGLEETLYRITAMLMIGPVSDGGQSSGCTTAGRRRILDRACGAIEASPERPLTLTEIERVSGASKRTLQYVFQSEFGCTPMQWQREQRLNRARQALLRDSQGINIASLAYETGFPSASLFSTHYKRLFLETPTETLRRRR
jgi:AraC-like DNA-binding protein